MVPRIGLGLGSLGGPGTLQFPAIDAQRGGGRWRGRQWPSRHWTVVGCRNGPSWRGGGGGGGLGGDDFGGMLVPQGRPDTDPKAARCSIWIGSPDSIAALLGRSFDNHGVEGFALGIGHLSGPEWVSPFSNMLQGQLTTFSAPSAARALGLKFACLRDRISPHLMQK